MSNTTSFELSKQLFEVAKTKGYELPKTTLYYCPKLGKTQTQTIDYWCDGITKSWEYDFYPSYTTEELLAWLPGIIKLDNGLKFRLSLSKHNDIFLGGYIRDDKYAPELIEKSCDTPSNTLCKLAIYLLKNDLMPKI